MKKTVMAGTDLIGAEISPAIGMLPVGRSSLAALPAKPAIRLDGERSMQAAMPVEACNDLSAAGLIAACGGKAARDGRPTE